MSIPITTPRGTLIVCVDGTNSRSFSVPGPIYRWSVNLITGRVYVCGLILPQAFAASGYAVVLDDVPLRSEFDVGYDIGRFKLAVLPKSITSLLTTVPLKIEERV